MASVAKHVVSFVGRNTVFNQLNSYAAKRTLYSSAAIGLDNYGEVRGRVALQFRNMEEKFRRRMEQCLQSESENIIFTEDLKNMIHLVENKPQDLDLCTQMMRKFNTQNKELRFGSYKFGPVVMRMFHFLGQCDLALKIAADPDFDGFFDQLTSYQVLLDMLYKAGKYSDVLKAFELVQQRQLYGSKYPKDCTLLTIAACYKLNTPESLKYTVDLMKGARESGAPVIRKASMLAAALALKQGAPQVAMEIVSLVGQSNYVTVRNLRIAALADMDRVEEALAVLKSTMEQDNPQFNRRKQEIFPEILSKVKEGVDRTQNKELELEFKNVQRGLKENQHISADTLDSLLLSPILPRLKFEDQGFDRNQRFGFEGNRGDFRAHAYSSKSQPMYRPRRGLKDFDD